MPKVRLSSINIAPQQTQTYVVQIRDDCGSTDTDDVLVTISPVPAANFTYVVNQGGFVQFTNLSLYSTSNFWTFGDGGSSTANNAVRIYTVAGNYTVTLIATNNCGSDTVSIQVNVILSGINTVAEEVNVAVWPNPSQGVFVAGFKSIAGEMIRMEVVSLQGQTIWSTNVTGKGGAEEVSVELPSIAKGYYLFKIKSMRMDKTISILLQ